jgi:hypothetical protein
MGSLIGLFISIDASTAFYPNEKGKNFSKKSDKM